MTRKGTNSMPDLTSEYLALRDQYIEARFTKLNPMQRQAVFTTEGPLLILAGAGPGKTTVLVNRIANIIRFGSAHGSKELARPVTEQDLNDLRTAVAIGRDLPRETAYLAVRPARPWNVLAITFTNKAAGELKERLRAMLGETLGGDVFASTFHSAFRLEMGRATRLAYVSCAGMPSASASPKASPSTIPMTSSASSSRSTRI